MNTNKPKVSGCEVTRRVNPVGGPMKRKTEETEGGGVGKRLAVGNGGPTGRYNLAKEVARLREENRKLKEGQETMQLQIQELRGQVFGDNEEPKVETNDEATASDAQENGENIAGEMVTEPVPLGSGPTCLVVRKQVLGEAKAPEVASKNQVASGSQGKRNTSAIEVASEPGSLNSEVLIPSEWKTVSKAGLCYYVLQTGTDVKSILKQIHKIDPSFLPKTGLIERALAIKLIELDMEPAELLTNHVLPFCRGNPGFYGVFNKLDRRTVWLHGPAGMGKETWLRKEFPPEQGYLYIYSKQNLKEFNPWKHKGIVAINFKMGRVHWPVADLRKLVGSDLDRVFDFGRKEVVVPWWTQRIVTSEHPPSDMFRFYKTVHGLKGDMWTKCRTEDLKGNMWRTIAVQVNRPIFSLIS